MFIYISHINREHIFDLLMQIFVFTKDLYHLSSFQNLLFRLFFLTKQSKTF